MLVIGNGIPADAELQLLGLPAVLDRLIRARETGRLLLEVEPIGPNCTPTPPRRGPRLSPCRGLAMGHGNVERSHAWPPSGRRQMPLSTVNAT